MESQVGTRNIGPHFSVAVREPRPEACSHDPARDQGHDGPSPKNKMRNKRENKRVLGERAGTINRRPTNGAR